MIMRKKNFAILFLTAVAICLTVLTFALKSPTLAYASRSNQGTDTVDEWSGTKTTGNLITIGSGSLTEQGWNNIHNQVYGEGRAYDDKNVGLKTPEYGWGIQAKGTNDDIGDKNYENGVWYRITLSEADRVKANNGELTVYASAMYYCQTAATHYVSLKLFYEDESGKQLDVDEMTDKITKSAYVLTLNGHPVRKNTASIRYYVSNWGTLGARPFIGGMTFTLSDSRAPKLENITSDKSGICDVTNNIAITGDTLKYYLELSEKVSVDSYGTAKLGLDGTATSITGDGSLITENGKSKICYTFKLTELGKSGALSLYSVSGLSVKDEAGNAFTYNKSDISSDTMQYYKQMYVASRLTNLKTNGKTAAFYGTDYTATLVPNAGYDLPQSVKVNLSGRAMDSAGYTYNKTTGLVTIKGKYVKGNLEIVAVGVPKTCMVTFEKQGGSGGTNSTTATYTSAMPQVTAPTLKGYTFQGYYASPNGQGKQYYTATGASANDCDFYTATTLYAHWTANSYTVKYDKNNPAATSGTVKGTTSNSSHTYNEAKALTPNGYSLVGYAFIGWATTANGSVVYKDKDSVQNLSSVDGATVTLYAVWKANTYYVEYDSNKPATASGTMTGTTSRSTHAYDASGALSESGFVLKGWTFVGWAQTADATSAQYAGGENVTNLASEEGAIVKLYAIWKANTYNVTYVANKPTGSSGTVTGETAQTTHAYDQASAAAINGFSLIGWSFIGWSQNPNATAIDFAGGADVLNLADTQGATVTLYAVWKANVYTITFDAVGGSLTEATRDATYDGSLSALAAPVRKGYNFNGYYSELDGNGIQYFDADGNSTVMYTVAGDVTLYAHWTPVTYNIQLYSQGQYVDTIYNVVFGHMRLPSAETLNVTRDNYNFVGWNLYDDQNWAMYNADTDYGTGIAYVEGETVILYAAWAEKPIFTISYDANGGIGAPAMAQAHQDETVVISNVVPSRKNYTFLGWATEADAVSAQYSPSDAFTMGSAVVTFYAVWKLNPSLTYDANGGTFSVPAECVYPMAGQTIALTDLVPERIGYVFQGWSADKDAAAAEYASGQNFTMPNADTVLFAVWKKAQYVVTVSASEGYTVIGLDEYYYQLGVGFL